jgi:type I restriction enzyme, S subunit
MELKEPAVRYFKNARTKQTDIGVLPQDWTVVPLHALSERIMVGIASAATHAYRDRGVVMFRNQNIKADTLDTEDVLFIDPKYEKTYKNKRLKGGDLLTARTGYPGTTSVVPADFAGSQSFTTLITRPIECRADSRYLCFFINGPAGQKYFEQAQIGGGQKNVNAASLKQLPIAVPSTLREQQAIAEALSDADALIESLSLLLAKKRKIKQGAMQELLTGERRLPGFGESWRDATLGRSIYELVAGVSVNADVEASSGVGVPSVVKTSALSAGKFNPQECKPIAARDLDRACTRPEPDTLLISRMNTPDLVGEVGYVDRDYDWLYLPDRIWMARSVAGSVCMRWLSSLLSSAPLRRAIADAATGTSGSMKNISNAALLAIPVRYPSVDEQRAIAEVLADMEADLTSVEARLAKARDLKQGMMQALLTGRIRLMQPAPKAVPVTA